MSFFLIKKLDYKVNKGLDERITKSSSDYEKLKSEIRLGFENVNESIVSLGNVVDGKIKLSEVKMEKEIEKIRKMVVLI